MLQVSTMFEKNVRLVGAALLLGPALLATSSWMDLFAPKFEGVVAGVGYLALAFAAMSLSRNWDREIIIQSTSDELRIEKANTNLAAFVSSLRPYGLLLTIATIALTANALIISTYSSSPQVTPRSLLSVIETEACPNFWAAVFINFLALLGWADLAITDR